MGLPKYVMDLNNGSYPTLRGLGITFSAFFVLTLAACGGSKPTPQATPTTPKQTTATATATTTTTAKAAPTGSDVTAPADSETSPPAEQVSETEDGAESTSDTPAKVTTAPTLKLTSAASEPKAMPSAFKEGVHYRRLTPTQPTNAPPGQVEIAEVFWYGCPHCFALESKLESWRKDSATEESAAQSDARRSKNKPSYVVFQRIPGAINEAALVHARVFYTAELLGKLETLHSLIFREVQLNGNPLNSMDKAKAFFAANGVSQADFDKVFTSFALESKLQNANMLLRRYRVSSVPFFVVNGKFTTDISSAGGEEQLFQLLNELAAREHVN
jgi:thiol:disulfide interchange protein DsbA